MIVIHVQTRVKADNREEFIKHIQHDTEISRGFAGCIQWGWSEEIGRANTFTLYEEWDTAEAFDAYKKSDHFKSIGNAIMALLAEEPKSAYYSAMLL